MMVMKNDIIEVYNKIAERYYKIRENMALKPEIDHFCNLLVDGDCILDAGCGNGRDLVFFKNKGFDVIGIDLSDGQLAIAKKRIEGKGITLIKKDIRCLDFPENIFGGIWCCAVLSHYRKNEVIKVLKSFHRMLKDGGISFLVVKKGTEEAYVIEEEFNGITRFTTFYSEEDVIDLALKCDFDIVEMYTFNERERFSEFNRDLDFLVVILKKKE